MMVKHNKLVRDKLPEILKEKGIVFRINSDEMSDGHFMFKLIEKFTEEYNEVMTSLSKGSRIEELTDLVEVIYAMVEFGGYTIEEFEALRLKKKEERGGFSKRILLLETL
jgi:predicted house-cleaning noncanonical NTP pyrophosphatase (MazG superfamily)